MRKVVIRKQGLVTNQSIFQTQQLAESWYAENRLLGSFGKLGGWFSAQELTQQQIDSALETSEVANPFPKEGEPLTFTIYKIADEFTHEIIDITLQFNADARAIRGKHRQEFGASIIAQVYGINEEKIAAGLFDSAKLQALLSNTTLAQIERFLFNGSISTAKVLIQSLDNTFYTDAEKSFIIGLIDSYLASGV